MTLEERNAMQRAQRNRCKICGDKFIKVPFVDHDHKSGKVRGLLCITCNTGIGMLRDCPEIIAAALKYITV
jgi:hypothetical protein